MNNSDKTSPAPRMATANIHSKDNAFNRLSRELVEAFSGTRPIHANSLLLSVYGDTICPYGGTIWLGSLIKLVEPLGINQRLVRTSVFRLSEKGILQSYQQGRRSYYTLTERGLRQFQTASQRIYAARTPSWDGDWRIVMTTLGNLDQEQREALNKELVWLGFSRLSTGIYAHPTADLEVVRTMLEDRQFSHDVAILQAADPVQSSASNPLIRQCFDLHASDTQYHEFVDTFQPILEAAHKVHTPDPALSFLVRILLIHKYRYILLHEPELPRELLPGDAISLKARDITRQLYLCLTEKADEHFLGIAKPENEAIRTPQDGYYRRFE